jgi:hypothetical protein
MRFMAVPAQISLPVKVVMTPFLETKATTKYMVGAVLIPAVVGLVLTPSAVAKIVNG